MYQNIYVKRTKTSSEVHIWDDKTGYSKFQYKPYAYLKSQSGTYRSLYGDKLKKVNFWTQDDLEAGNVFESESKQKYNGSGTRGTLPIPTNHRLQGGLYSAEFNLSYELNGIRRGFTIFRPNLFAVIPTYKDKEAGEFVRPGQEFVTQGINF